VFVNQHPTNLKGSVAELKIAAEAARLGIGVLFPITEHGCYDLAFETRDRILRVQCKWGSLITEMDIIVARVSRSRHTPRGYVVRSYSEDEVDAFAIYCGALDRCYLLPADVVAGQFTVHLRVGAPRNGQKAGLHFADDYLLQGAVAQWEERSAGSRKVGGSNPPSSIGAAPASRAHAVGAHEFRCHFGYFMELTAAGAEIHVTRRGKPYVRLLGHQPTLTGSRGARSRTRSD
jgi:PD-(D/E)XK endonuclease